MNLGAVAFWMMIVILGATLLKLLSYDKWKLLHQWMSVVFILASLHIVLSERRMGGEFVEMLVLPIFAAGLFAILYKQVFLPFFSKQEEFTVLETKKINENLILVTLQAKEKETLFVPGQYGFFTFETEKLPKEPHPFTFVTAPGKQVNLLVKARGDFTKAFYECVGRGDQVFFEGPYGRLDYKQGKKRQIWIGGGVGIAPFLSWLDEIKGKKSHITQIDFHVCMHSRKDVVFSEELEKMTKEIPGFRVFFHCTEENTRLKVEDLALKDALEDASIFMCGPKKLTRFFKRKLLASQIKSEDIYFEDFEFF